MKRVKIKLKIVSKNFLTENIFTVNQSSYFIRVKFLIASSLVVLKIHWKVRLSKVILETWKQDMVNHDISVSTVSLTNFSVPYLVAIPRLQKQPLGGALQKLNENDEHLWKSWCFSKEHEFLRQIRNILQKEKRFVKQLFCRTPSSGCFCRLLTTVKLFDLFTFVQQSHDFIIFLSI